MGPFVRIVLRYGVGGVVGYEIGTRLASDPDVVVVGTMAATVAVGACTEGFYLLAKRLGWRT